MKSGTPNYMVYEETGAFPTYIDIQCRIISFWARTVLSENPIKLSSTLYRVIYSLHTYSNISTTRLKWIKNVKEILTTCGMSGIWDAHVFPTEKWLVCAVKQKLKDIFITNWHSQTDNNSSRIIYKLIKIHLVLKE